MSDNFQVGGIEAKLTLNVEEFQRSLQQSESDMKGLYTQINTMPPAVAKLQQQEEKLTRQMEEQRKVIVQMDANLDEVKAQYAALQQAAGNYSDADMDVHFAKETAEIEKAEAQLGEYAQKIKLVEQQKQAALEKANASGVAAAEKQQYRDNSLAIDAVANSLRGLSPLLGDTIGNVSTLAERLVFMKRSMDTAASSSAAMGAAISGGITLAIAGIGMLVSAIQKADEERERAYQEAVDSLADYEEQLREASKAMEVLDDQTSGVLELKDARQQLADLFPEMILGYDEEGQAILKNSQAMDAQLEKLREQVKLNRDLAIANSGNVYDDYQKTVNFDFWGSIGDELEAYWNTNILFNYDYYEQKAARDASEQFNALQKAIELCNLEIEKGITGYDYLDERARRVVDSMISSESERIAKIAEENERIAEQQKLIDEINSMLGDSEEVEKRYNILISTSSGANEPTEEMINNVTKIADAMVEEQKRAAEEAYENTMEAAQRELEDEYALRKEALDNEYEAVTDSLNAQLDAYRSLKFTIRSLDEDELANKIDLLNRQVEAEEDAQARAVLAVQERYYKEAQLITENANREIQAYKDRLAALDEADREAQEARTARQNANKLQDLNESYAKQEAENAREMAAALEEYEQKRDELQEIIDNPPSRTAGILARRELDELNKQWAEEQEGMEIDHADKLLQIQRKLDEEKLSQKEAAEAAEREKEREKLNQQVEDLQTNAEQQLAILNNRYTVEAEVRQKALEETLKDEKKSYQDRLKSLNEWQEKALKKAEEEAAAQRDLVVKNENLLQETIEKMKQESYDSLLKQAKEFGLNLAEEGKSAGEQYWEAFAGKIQQETNWQSRVPSNLPDYYPPSLRGYAAGGVVTAPTYAVVGEGGEPEAILPMSKLYTLVNSVLSGSTSVAKKAYAAMQSRGGRSTSYSRTVSTTVNVDTLEIRNEADVHLLAAEIASYVGGANRW